MIDMSKRWFLMAVKYSEVRFGKYLNMVVFT